MKLYISGFAIRKILKNAGASRVSIDAIKSFQEKLNILAFDNAQKAVRLAKHAKRKTVDVSDIKLAFNS